MVEEILDTYHFKAGAPDGGVFAGQLRAASESDALRRLRSAGYVPIRLEDRPIRTSILDREISRGGRRRLSVEDCEGLCRELSIMLGTGIALIEAMSILGSSARSGSQLCSFCLEVRHWLRLGSSLSGAIASSRFECPTSLVPVVRSGEDSGKLVVALGMLAGTYRDSAKFSRLLIGALTYPAFLLATAIGVLLIIAFFVAPSLLDLFAALDRSPPPVIAMLDAARAFVIGNAGLLGIVGIATGLACAALLRRPSIRSALLATAYLTPPINALLVWSASRRFAETLKLYIVSNVPLAAALPNALIAAGLPYGARHADQLAVQLRQGVKLSIALAQIKALPAELIHLLRVGEGSGRLAETLDAAAQEAGIRIERQSALISTMLAPILILIVGTLIGTVIFAVFSSLLEINEIAI